MLDQIRGQFCDFEVQGQFFFAVSANAHRDRLAKVTDSPVALDSGSMVIGCVKQAWPLTAEGLAVWARDVMMSIPTARSGGVQGAAIFNLSEVLTRSARMAKCPLW